MYADVYRELQSSAWNETNPDRCPCGGRGWILSDFDTWHRCQTHGFGVPHPEDDEATFDYGAHKIEMLRQAYRVFKSNAQHLGLKGRFQDACLQVIVCPVLSPSVWVSAAEEVADRLEAQREEAAAHAAGFSCALEARWAADAESERHEHGRY